MISKEEAQETLKNMAENFPTLYVEGQRNDFAVDWCILHCIAQGTCDPTINHPTSLCRGTVDHLDLADRVETIKPYLKSWWITGNIDYYIQQTPAYWNKA